MTQAGKNPSKWRPLAFSEETATQNIIDQDGHENCLAHLPTTAKMDVIVIIACFVVLLLLAAWVS
jgi:hypothetical protein